MAVERNNAEERQARLAKMIGEFRAAQQRRAANQGIALWKQTERTQRKIPAPAAPAPTKLD